MYLLLPLTDFLPLPALPPPFMDLEEIKVEVLASRDGANVVGG